MNSLKWDDLTLYKCNHLSKYDGKKNYEAILNNQKEQANFVTVVEEPSNQFVDFFKVSSETGQELADGIWNNVIVPTESKISLVAQGTGNFKIKLDQIGYLG